jgi:hypothetical protein
MITEAKWLYEEAVYIDLQFTGTRQEENLKAKTD